jgi:leucyl aminopeptidase (aminopeptidase T)
MSWPQKDAITQGVVDMLRVNMGLKSGEALLVVTDVPRSVDWQKERHAKLKAMSERALLGRLVAKVGAEKYPDCTVVHWPFLATGRHGAEPDEDTAARMRAADVVVAITTYSLSHTNARTGATEAGARVASMPEFEAHMLEPGGPMAADYVQIAADCQVFAERLTAAKDVVVRAPHGTDLRFSVEGRPGEVDNGLYGSEPGMWGNLPAGETYAIPLEGTAEGRLVAPAGWYPFLEEDMVFRFEGGEVVELSGGGGVGDKFRELLKLGEDDPACRARRNLAELGIGTNPNARKPDNVLEAEKIKGTVHIAIGDNIHMGGVVEADLHDDFVQPEADLYLDGEPVILNGEWRIAKDG